MFLLKLSVVKDRFYRGDVMRNTSLEEELRSGKTCVSTTVGDSMEPMLRNRRDYNYYRTGSWKIKAIRSSALSATGRKICAASYPACEKRKDISSVGTIAGGKRMCRRSGYLVS